MKPSTTTPPGHRLLPQGCEKVGSRKVPSLGAVPARQALPPALPLPTGQGLTCIPQDSVLSLSSPAPQPQPSDLSLPPPICLVLLRVTPPCSATQHFTLTPPAFSTCAYWASGGPWRGSVSCISLCLAHSRCSINLFSRSAQPGGDTDLRQAQPVAGRQTPCQTGRQLTGSVPEGQPGRDLGNKNRKPRLFLGCENSSTG